MKIGDIAPLRLRVQRLALGAENLAKPEQVVGWLGAVQSQEFALARWSLCADELEVGRLVSLFPRRPPLRTGLAYYVVGPRERLRSGPAAAFRDWLVAETEHLRQLGERR